jgi:hypothetical protein
MNQAHDDDHIRTMTTWQTPSRPMEQRRRQGRSETLLAMILIPLLVAMIVMMLIFLPLIAVAG